MWKLLLALSACCALELSPANYDEKTAGKTVFLKFFAPWCGHCKAMKGDWDNLMAKYADNAKILVADVDCTADGKPLCEANGVKGFPTLKHGDPANLEDYEGGRDYAALDTFAGALKPVCSPANMELCDEEDKAKIEQVQALSDAELQSQIEAADNKAKDAEQLFTDELAKLQAAYQDLTQAKEATLAEVKASGVGLLKAVKAARGAASKTEL